MNPLFGSTLYNVIFEFNSAELIPIIDSTIRSDIQTWMPYLRIKNIAVNIGDTNRDNYTVNIQIAFAVDQLGLADAQLVDITLTKPII